MSAFSRRITAGKPTPPEHRRLSQHVQFRQPTTTVRCHQNSSKLQLTKNQRLGLINHQINHDRRIIEVRSDGGELKHRTWKTTPSSLFICRVADSIVHHDDNHEDDDQHLHHGDEKEEKDQTVEVMVAAGVTVVLGVANRVLYKLALVPLKHYPFFLAQFATFGYVAVYFFILFLRHRAGFVTKEMLSLPQAPFLAVGLLEALAAASGMAAGTMLSGASIPILSQTFLVWQLLLSVIFLGRRYNVNQIVGCLLVSMGVIITVTSGSGAGPSLNQTSIFWSILMIFSFLLQAGDTILKEVIFLDAADRLKEGTVDIFVVNSFGSAYQALFICLLLPFLSKMWGIPFSQLPSYLKDGAACFLNVNSLSTGCNGAPLLPVLFVVVNMCFNISLLHLIRISSAVVSCLASTVSVPLSVFVFTLPLPYLGAGTTLPPGFVAGAVVLLLGLFFYSWKPAMVPAPAASATTS